jgi:hypothetical protein
VTTISEKTFIGQVERGFDILGYYFGPEGLTAVDKTIEQFVARAPATPPNSITNYHCPKQYNLNRPSQQAPSLHASGLFE